MKIIRKSKILQNYIKSAKQKKEKVGFVPTMGYLHEGHLSLLKKSRRENDITVLSIFVNPKQFGRGEDFTQYPRDKKRDETFAKKEKVDIIFYPSEKEMYPSRYLTYVDVERFGNGLCGKFRPGHFKGVTTVVAKLLNIVLPDTLYLGQKDAQQAIIIKKMITDLNFPVKVKVLPTVRESDGLAKSSRNNYLANHQRKDAPILYKALRHVKKLIFSGERKASIIKKEISRMIRLKNTKVKIDYIECVDIETLKPVKKIKGKILIALTVWYGKTRLIDNIVVNV